MALPDAIRLFERYADALRCPLCAGALAVRGGSLICPRGHTYDISSRGTAHIAPSLRGSAGGYTRELFMARARVLESGLYDPVADAVLRLSGLEDVSAPLFVDAGCGEGFYAARLLERLGRGLAVGLDASAEAVRLAAARRSAALFVVGDLARMPVASGAADAVLNILSPANYAEFARVLKPGGRIVKVSPGEQYLWQLRALVPGVAETYQAGAVEAWLARHARVLQSEEILCTVPIAQDVAQCLKRMTPLTRGEPPRGELRQITLHLRVTCAQPITPNSTEGETQDVI